MKHQGSSQRRLIHRKKDTFKLYLEKYSVKNCINIKFKASLFTPCRRIGGLEAELHLFLTCSEDGVVKYTLRQLYARETPYSHTVVMIAIFNCFRTGSRCGLC